MRTIQHVVVVKYAKPEEVYKMLLHAKEHSDFTGTKCIVTPETGSKFDLYDGYIRGQNLELIKNQKIVQKWRGEDWKDPTYYSEVIFELLPFNDNDTQIIFTHKNIPDENAADICTGWYMYYWDKMNAYTKQKHDRNLKQGEDDTLKKRKIEDDNSNASSMQRNSDVLHGICKIEIPVKNMKRAQKFYHDIFGWTFQEDDNYSLFDFKGSSSSSTPGLIKGALVLSNQQISSSVTFFIKCENIHPILEKVKQHGCLVVKEEVKIINGSSATITDTEGNNVGLFCSHE